MLGYQPIHGLQILFNPYRFHIIQGMGEGVVTAKKCGQAISHLTNLKKRGLGDTF